jgi:hypothetical protein
MQLAKKRMMGIAAGIGALIAALVAGCSAAPDDSPDYILDESNATAGEDSPGAESESGPVVVEGSEVEPVVEETGDAGMDATPAPKPDAGVMVVTKSQTCTSRYGSHKSVSKITWTSAPGPKLTIKSLTVQVSNSANRNANDVDVFVRYPGGSEFLAFNSGDILADNKLRAVPYKAATVVKPSTRIRVLTNFDQEGGDPAASCSITIVP